VRTERGEKTGLLLNLTGAPPLTILEHIQDRSVLSVDPRRPNLLRAQREAAARVTRCPGIPRSPFAPHFPTGANGSEASRKSSASEFTSDLGHSSKAFPPDGAAPEGLDLKTSEGYDWRARTAAATACATGPITPLVVSSDAPNEPRYRRKFGLGLGQPMGQREASKELPWAKTSVRFQP